MARMTTAKVRVELSELGFDFTDIERLRRYLLWGQRLEQVHSPSWTSNTYTPDGGTQHQPDALYQWLTRPAGDAPGTTA